jgi:hypothetical protein
MAWQTRVSEWITSEEAALPNKHMIAEDCCNFRFPVRDLVPGVSVVNFHYAYAEAALENYGLGKALSYDETGFLGQSDDVYQRQAWNFILSGGGVFDNLDYSFTVGHEDGTDTAANGPGGGSPELRRRLKILADFMRGLPLLEMAPDFTTVKHAGGVVTHMLSSASGVYAMYVDGAGPAEITLRLPPGDYEFSWVDVVNSAIIRGKTGGGEVVLTTPKFKNGIALRINRVGKGESGK